MVILIIFYFLQLFTVYCLPDGSFWDASGKESSPSLRPTNTRLALPSAFGSLWSYKEVTKAPTCLTRSEPLHGLGLGLKQSKTNNGTSKAMVVEWMMALWKWRQQVRKGWRERERETLHVLSITSYSIQIGVQKNPRCDRVVFKVDASCRAELLEFERPSGILHVGILENVDARLRF